MALHKAERLEDPGAELLDRATSLWDRYGRIVLGAVVAAVAIVAIWFFVARGKNLAEDQAAGRLAEANMLFWQGEYARSQTIAQEVAQKYPSTPSGLDARRLVGEDAFWTGDFKKAITEFKYYVDHAKGELADAARRSLAYSLESDKQYLEAAQNYEKLIGKYDHESSAEFLFAAARCYRQANQKDKAVQALQRLVTEFGETSYANRARIELGELGVTSS